MGLGPAFLDDLIELKKRGSLDGAARVVEIGAQQLSERLIMSPRLEEAAALFDAKGSLQFVPASDFADAPLAHSFWLAIGFQHESVDLHGGTIRLDLNRGRAPWRWRGTADLVVNAGTTEHVANQGNAFAVIHSLTRCDGVMYHELPGGGPMDHGLFAYQPKFFHTLARVNGYEELFFKIVPCGMTKLPSHVAEHNQRHVIPMPREIEDISLRIAFRKRHAQRFVMPTDG